MTRGFFARPHAKKEAGCDGGWDPEEASTLAPDDQGRLLVAAASGDRPAFISLFPHFAPHIKAYLVRSGTRPDVAEGIAQDVMLAVWRNASAYDPAIAAAWIFAIARNPRIDLVRHERWPEIGPNDPQLRQAGPEDAEIVFQRTQIGARLRRAIETLPVEQDEALAETFLSDISYDEYPTWDELPLGTVKSRLRLDLEGAS